MKTERQANADRLSARQEPHELQPAVSPHQHRPRVLQCSPEQHPACHPPSMLSAAPQPTSCPGQPRVAADQHAVLGSLLAAGPRCREERGWKELQRDDPHDDAFSSIGIAQASAGRLRQREREHLNGSELELSLSSEGAVVSSTVRDV